MSDRRPARSPTSRLATWAAKLRERFLDALGGPVARVEWCRTQRQSLRDPGHSVVWVRAETLPWARWGAQRGYFELERMDGLTYLRALGTVGTD